jgi:hypothetical protein
MPTAQPRASRVASHAGGCMSTSMLNRFFHKLKWHADGSSGMIAILAQIGDRPGASEH